MFGNPFRRHRIINRNAIRACCLGKTDVLVFCLTRERDDWRMGIARLSTAAIIFCAGSSAKSWKSCPFSDPAQLSNSLDNLGARIDLGGQIFDGRMGQRSMICSNTARFSDFSACAGPDPWIRDLRSYRWQPSMARPQIRSMSFLWAIHATKCVPFHKSGSGFREYRQQTAADRIRPRCCRRQTRAFARYKPQINAQGLGQQ